MKHNVLFNAIVIYENSSGIGYYSTYQPGDLSVRWFTSLAGLDDYQSGVLCKNNVNLQTFGYPNQHRKARYVKISQDLRVIIEAVRQDPKISTGVYYSESTDTSYITIWSFADKFGVSCHGGINFQTRDQFPIIHDKEKVGGVTLEEATLQL